MTASSLIARPVSSSISCHALSCKRGSYTYTPVLCVYIINNVQVSGTHAILYRGGGDSVLPIGRANDMVIRR